MSDIGRKSKVSHLFRVLAAGLALLILGAVAVPWRVYATEGGGFGTNIIFQPSDDPEGDLCSSNSDCGAGYYCEKSGFFDFGRCAVKLEIFTRPPIGPRFTPTPRPTIHVWPTSPPVLPTPATQLCTDDDDCADGEYCHDLAIASQSPDTSIQLPELGVCREYLGSPPCSVDADCEEGQFCELLTDVVDFWHGPPVAAQSGIVLPAGFCKRIPPTQQPTPEPTPEPTPRPPSPVYPRCETDEDCPMDEFCHVFALFAQRSGPPIRTADPQEVGLCVPIQTPVPVDPTQAPTSPPVDPTKAPTGTPVNPTRAPTVPTEVRSEESTITPTVVFTATSTSEFTATPTSEFTATSTSEFTATPTWTPITEGDCHGDCNGDGVVSIGELIRMVAIALEKQPMSVCESMADLGSVGIGDLIRAVANSLDGCPLE